jgi:hypothetical protein
MGIDVSFYAVDLPRLLAFAQQSVEDLLFYYADHGREKRLVLRRFPENIAYLTEAGSGVFRLEGNVRIPLRRKNDTDAAFLTRSIQDYASAEIWHFKWVLTALAACPGGQCVTEICPHSRRWWIGSVLKAAAPTVGLESRDYQKLALLFPKVLGRWERYEKLNVVSFIT